MFKFIKMIHSSEYGISKVYHLGTKGNCFPICGTHLGLSLIQDACVGFNDLLKTRKECKKCKKIKNEFKKYVIDNAYLWVEKRNK